MCVDVRFDSVIRLCRLQCPLCAKADTAARFMSTGHRPKQTPTSRHEEEATAGAFT
jgi:hypothetical protein